VIAYDAQDKVGGGLSFSRVRVGRSPVTRSRQLALENLSDRPVTYTIIPTFRYDDDADSATVSVPPAVSVGPGEVVTVPVTLMLDGATLPDNAMDSGSNGANPVPLTTQELDGYLWFTAEDHRFTLPWQILPIKGTHTLPDSFELNTDEFGNGQVGLSNLGVGTAQIDVFSLLATSEEIPEGDRGEQAPTPDLRAVGVATFAADGLCASRFVWAFGINLWEPRSHIIPVINSVFLDIDRDGTDDYAILNSDASGPFGESDGRQLAWSVNLETGEAVAFFFLVHSMNSGNVQLYVCGEQIGLTAADLFRTPVAVTFRADDFFFGGPGDEIGGITIVPGAEPYVGVTDDIPAGASGVLSFSQREVPGNTPEPGLLLFTDGLRALPGAASRKTEALVLKPTE